MVLIQLLLRRLLHILLVLSISASLLLHRGAEVSNDLVSRHCVGVISVKVIDDDDVVSVTGTTSSPSTHMVIGGAPVRTNTPPSCIVNLMTMMLSSRSLSNTLIHMPR